MGTSVAFGKEAPSDVRAFFFLRISPPSPFDGGTRRRLDEGGSEEGTASELAKEGGAVAILAGKREDGEEKRGGGKDEGESGGEPRRVEPHLGCPLFFISLLHDSILGRGQIEDRLVKLRSSSLYSSNHQEDVQR